jgi:tRNA threonylcarbamoyladenosine biosynthesis protein TsaE
LSISVVTHSPGETRSFATRLVREYADRHVFALHGELGAGKTCFVQGLADALNIDRPVTSPTFTLIREYAGRRPLYHIDLYRLRGTADAAAIGLEDYLRGPGLVAVEWAERAADLFSPDTIHVRLEAMDDPESRRITVVL